MHEHPVWTFFLILGCLFIIASSCLMIRVTSRTPRRAQRIAGITFWSALALQTTDNVLTYLFDGYPIAFATVRGSWHLIALGVIGALALTAWSVLLYVDGPGSNDSTEG